MARKLRAKRCSICGRLEDNCMCDNPQFEIEEVDLRSPREKFEDEQEEDIYNAVAKNRESKGLCGACAMPLEECICNERFVDADFEE